MSYNNFIVKNGITVNGSFTANSTVVNTAALTATSVNATSYTIASGTFYANSTTVNTANVLASTTVNIGANVVANTSTLFIGNSTVNTNIVAGTVSINGTSVATMITGNAATAYANAVANSAALYAPLAGATFTGQINTTALGVTGSANIGGNLTVSGNLTFSGSTTFVNSTVITTNDKALYLANGSTSALSDGGGIYIGNNVASLLWNNSTTSLQSNVALYPAASNLLLGGPSNLWNLNANVVNAVSVIIGGTNVNSAISTAASTAYANAVANAAAAASTAYANAVANAAAIYAPVASPSFTGIVQDTTNYAASPSGYDAAENLVFLNSTNITGLSFSGSDNRFFTMGIGPANSVFMRTGSSATLELNVGKVGIGTGTPAVKLDVSGAIRSSTGIFVNSIGNEYAGSWISVFRKDQNANTVLLIDNETVGSNAASVLELTTGTPYSYISHILYDNNGNPFYQLVGGSNVASGGYYFKNQYWGNTPGSPQVSLVSNGNFGIGTTSPAYNLDVTGNIHASANLYSVNINTNSLYSTSINANGAVINGTNGYFSAAGSGTAGQLQAVGGSGTNWYNAFLRNDGASVYLMQSAVQTSQGAATNASWNSYRPFQWSLGSGAVIIDNSGSGTTFGGVLTAPSITLNTTGTGISFPSGVSIYEDGSGNGPGDLVIGTNNGTGHYTVFYSNGSFNAPGTIYQGGSAVATQSYVTGYAPTLTGSGASGTWGININGYNTTTYNGYTGAATLQTPSSTATWANYPVGYSAMISTAAYGVPSGAQYGYFYKISNRDVSGGWGGIWENFDGSNLYYGATSANTSYATWKNILDASNYNSYAPSLTGSGASGTWGINVTGSAASITGTYGGSITSSQITTGLGYTPYNSTNPSGYITSSSLSSYAALSGATFTGSINSGSSVVAANTNSSAIVTGSSFVVGGNGGNYLAFGQSTGTYAQWIQSGYNGNATRYSINLNPGGGNVGINTGINSDAAYNLDVNGKIRATYSIGVGSAAPSTTTGQILASDNIIAYYSDARLKENITPIPDALAKVNTLSGVTYNSNDLAESYGYTDRSQQVGVIAQEVKAVLPQVIKPAPFDTDSEGNSKSGENYMTVQYEKLVPLLIEAIKELTAKVNDLESKLGGN